MKNWRVELLGPSILVAAGVLIFGPGALRAGLHLDDFGFQRVLSGADLAGIWREFLSYVPGRNLYILYVAALYRTVGPDPAWFHAAGLVLDLLNVCLAYALLRQARVPAGAALISAGFFLVMPNHGETHFWASSVAMNLLSTTFLFGAFLVAGAPARRPTARLAAAAALFALALFDYDQAFLMWIPLAFYMRRLAPAPRPRARSVAALAAACLALDATQAALRLLARRGAPGPLPHLGRFSFELLHSFIYAAFPLRGMTALGRLPSWAGGTAETLLLAGALGAAWILAAARAPSNKTPAPPPRDLAVFGALWALCAYLPNYFLYVSPRHNYLPSFGLIAAATGAGLLLAKTAGARAAIAATAFALFSLCAGQDLAEGWCWAASGRLHERLAADAARLLPPDSNNLFVLGAPLRFGRAPVFLHPHEPLWVLAQRTGRALADGDISLAPTRRGAFYANELEHYGETFSWRPYAGLRALEFRPDGTFACLSRLTLLPSGGPAVSISLADDPRCRPSLPLAAAVWLESSRRGARDAAREALFSASNGADLIGLSVSPGDQADWFRLNLRWRARRDLASDFACMVSLSAGDRPVFQTVFARRSPAGDGYALSWPLYDDLDPASRWKRGTIVSESYRVKSPPPNGPLTAVVSVFEREGAAWRKIDTFTIAARGG